MFHQGVDLGSFRNGRANFWKKNFVDNFFMSTDQIDFLRSAKILQRPLFGKKILVAGDLLEVRPKLLTKKLPFAGARSPLNITVPTFEESGIFMLIVVFL